MTFTDIKKLRTIHTTTYKITDGFRLDLVIDSETHEYGAWLHHNDYGVKEFLLGMVRHTPSEWSLMDFLDIVLSSIEDNMTRYLEKYMDE